MSIAFKLKSNSSDRELVISKDGDEALEIQVIGFQASARVKMWCLEGFDGGIASYFSELAHLEKPWSNERSWSSLDEEFALIATCNPLGNVTFRVCLNLLDGRTDGYKLICEIGADLGQLQSISSDIKGLFYK